MLDIRTIPGRGPKCEVGLCRNRAVVSIGDDRYAGGLGRLNICQDCLDQMKTLLVSRETKPTPVVAPEPEPTPVEEPTHEDYEDMERPALLKLAKERGLKLSATVKTADVIQALRDQDALA